MLTIAEINSSQFDLAKWIPLLPLLAMLICGLFGALRNEGLRKLSGVVTTAAIFGSFICSLLVWIQMGGAAQFAAEHPHGVSVHAFEWINIGDFSGNFSFFIDPLTVIMLLVVTGIGTLISLYATGYMKGDPGYYRFFAYIGLFIVAMSCLVLADNLLLLFLGWEGVGLASYLLIGFYYKKPSAAAAAKKAFIVNRIGDFGFALGLMGIFLVFGTINYTGILPAAGAIYESSPVEHGYMAPVDEHGEPIMAEAEQVSVAPANQAMALNAEGHEAVAHVAQSPWAETLLLWIPFLLMLGAFGKSAQLPLHVWLPDAMEGPTPVSALIHAATMVTAGVYMISRLIDIFQLSPYALPTVAVIGALTALFAATVALTQYDIKRVWAYSTVSQLGYMFLGVGVLGTFGAVFHLYTHAFFKALLFLTAGSVMHALAGQLDMRHMGGLRKKMPVTCWLMFVGCLALAGVPPLAGFFSKDEILYQAMANSWILGGIGLLVAFMTAFYTFRLWFTVFCGEEKYTMGDEHHGYSPSEHPWVFAKHGSIPPDAEERSAQQAHEAPAHAEADHGAHGDEHHDDHHHHEPHEMPMWPMNAPLIVLAIGAALIGLLTAGWFEGMIDQSSAAVVKEKHGEYPWHYISHFGMAIISSILALAGIGLAYVMYVMKPDLPARVVRATRPLYVFFHNKWYFDELYLYGIVIPLRSVGWVCYLVIDRWILDAGIVDGVLQWTPKLLGYAQAPLQRGRLQGFALNMGLGLLLILAIVVFTVLI